MPAKKQPEINLLPTDKFAKSVFGRFITWLLSTFRVIVIFVEMVVMLAFLSRFWLDAKNSDLNDELDQKEAIVIASQEFETNYNRAAQQLALFLKLEGGTKTYWETLNKIKVQVPPDINLKAISLETDKVQLSGQSPSAQSIALLMANLKSTPEFSQVALNGLSENPETGMLEFKIGQLPKKEGVK